MTIKMICAVILSFLFATAFGKYYIPWLRKQKAGQQIKSEVDWHKSKSGTPTMGGVMFIGGTALVCLTLGFPNMLRGRFVHIFVLLFRMAHPGGGSRASPGGAASRPRRRRSPRAAPA